MVDKQKEKMVYSWQQSKRNTVLRKFIFSLKNKILTKEKGKLAVRILKSIYDYENVFTFFFFF